MKVLTFSRSNSASSINQELSKHIVQHLEIPSDVIDLRNCDIPIFSIDSEKKNGFPIRLQSLYDTIKSYYAFIISITEHNGNYRSFFKNIIKRVRLKE